MNDERYAALRSQVFAHYAQQQWTQALALLDALDLSQFTVAVGARIVFWRACFLALSGQRDAAVHTLEAGLRQGYWWSEIRLRHDSDLAALQGVPALEQIIAECRQRQQQAEGSTQTEHVVIAPPAATREPYPLFMTLHGYDSNNAENLPYWSPLAEQGWLVAGLQSSQISGMGGYHWTDEERARADVQQHVDALTASFPIDPDRTVLAGFSNGGRTALMLALTGAIRVPYAISVAAALRDETLEALDWTRIHPAPPRLLLICGDQDQQVLPRALQQSDHFVANGLDVTLQVVAGMGHTFPPDLIERVQRWLNAHFSGSTPQETP